MNEARSHRVFFALWPDHEVQAHLSALASELTAKGGGRLIHPAALHLTLAFVGAVTPAQLEQIEEIGRALRGEAFDLSLDRLGFWPQRGILWAGCRQPPAPLKRLAADLAEGLRAAGFSIDPRSASALVPHVTLARRARCGSLPRLGSPLTWHVSEFALLETHLHPSAASYKTLTRFALDAADAQEG